MAGNYKHGLRHKRIYNIWKSMRQRCNNPKCRNYKNYGAKGIEVCEEWNDPVVFAEWAYKHGYDDTLTIDRIDVLKGYTPDNCRWTTYKLQANNKRNNVKIEFNGQSHTFGEWASITGISVSTLWARIHVCGWSIEDALLKPVWANDTRFKSKIVQ